MHQKWPHELPAHEREHEQHDEDGHGGRKHRLRALDELIALARSGEQFTDVGNVAYDRASRPSREQISEALRYYSEHDTFLEL